MVTCGEPRGERLVAARGYDVSDSCRRRPVSWPTGDFLGGVTAQTSFSISRHAHRGLRRTRSRAA